MALLGKPFRKYVQTQIDKREEALGKGPTIGSNNDVSKTFSQNVPWIRLSSGVDLTNEEIVKTRIRGTGEVTFTPQPTPIDNTFVFNQGELQAQLAETQQAFAAAGFSVPGSNEETEGLTLEEEAALLGISLDELNTTTTSPQNNIPQPPLQNNTPPPSPTTTTIPLSGSVLDKLVKRGYNENEIKGAELAKHFVLFGGVISQENSSIQRYSGLSGNRWGGAYGFGLPSDISKERGYVPMPGIESVDFSYKNDGALAQATVKIKCYSRSQFEIIDILYMRPGYTVLLEFGHSVFIDNNNKVARAGEGDYSFYTEPFSKMSSKVSFSDLKSKILEEKETWNGNYEGFYAKITKFNWSFSNNVYDITINLVGFGDVISSLNAAPSPSFEEVKDLFDLKPKDEERIEESQTAIVSQALKSSLNTKLFTLYLREGGRIKEKIGTDYVTTNSEGEPQGNAPQIFGLDITTDFGDKKALYPKGMKYKSYDETKGEIKVETFKESFPLSFFQVFNVKEAGNKSKRDAYYPNMYISFGAFCAILQNEVNLFTKEGEFLINIDINYANLSEDKNIMRTFPGMFSADPSKVLIPYLPHEGRTSTDVFGKGGMLDEIMNNSLIEGATKHLRPNFYLDIDKGRLAYVLLDMAYLANVVSSNVNKNEKTLTISPLKILEDILSTINKTTGGINEFKVIEDTDTGFIKILSEVPQDNNDDDDLKSINSYGFTKNNFLSSDIRGSFVKSLNLSSELSENWASQISIGAQNNSSQQGGNGASFSEYSKGLIDRIIPEKLSTNPDKNQDPPETLDDITNTEILKKIQLLYRLKYGIYEWSSETISPVLTFNKNYASLLTGLNAKKQYAPTPFYIPFNLSLDLLGLGGLRIYDGFKFDGKVLPISYQPESIKLIIKGLSHNVSVDGWTTKVETLAQPIAKLIKPENTVQSVIVLQPDVNESNSNNSGVGDSSSCNQLKNKPYDATAGGRYPNLRNFKFTGQDPRTGLTFQGTSLSAFSKLMKSSDGADLPKAGYGVARKAFEQLQIIGDEASKKGLTGLTINSHYRSPVYNCQIGGAPNSMHKTGGAIDIGTTNPRLLYNLIESLISQSKILQGGVGLYGSFVHYDIRGKYARW